MTKLPPNWTQHTAPSGHFYYYNSITKESTYERPINQPKRQKPTAEIIKNIPKFKYAFPNTNWCLIITNSGAHFFHNIVTKESRWQADDPGLLEALRKVDTKYLLLLIAKARGLELDHETNDELDRVRNVHRVGETTPKDQSNVLTAENAEKNASGALEGYSSSGESEEEEATVVPNLDESHQSDSSSDSEDEYQNQATQYSESSSEEENALNLSDLDDTSSSDSEEKVIGSSKVPSLTFFQLLSSSNLNPYSSWEIESSQIINDPRFYDIDTNNERRELFNEWSKAQIEQLKQSNHSAPIVGQESTSNYEDFGDETQEELIDDRPIIQYFKLITSKDTELPPFFFEFKELYENELDEFKTTVNDREQERIYKEYYQLHKKTETEKYDLLKEFFKSSKIFKKTLSETDINTVKRRLSAIETALQDIKSEKDSYFLLHKLENQLKISDSIKFNTRYWIVGPVERIKVIEEVINSLFSI